MEGMRKPERKRLQQREREKKKDRERESVRVLKVIVKGVSVWASVPFRSEGGLCGK